MPTNTTLDLLARLAAVGLLRAALAVLESAPSGPRGD